MKSPYESPKTNPELDKGSAKPIDPNMKMGKKRIIIIIACCLMLPLLLFVLILFRKQSLITG